MDISINEKLFNKNETESAGVEISAQDLPDSYFSLLMEYTSYTMVCVAVFGMAGNIFILITYAKIGFSESINISYFALVCAIFLGIHLHRNASWRLGNANEVTKTTGKSSGSDNKALKKYSKDIRVAKTVLAIALAFIFLGTLSTLRIFLALIWTDFRPLGIYRNLFRFTTRLAFLMSLANSSVNFIIYFKMGSKFRATVKQMIFRN
ncbi:hypothetical protein RRG08_055173 [Elysia crispata]|uniref:G-protein coupled receptors family 1 profile domain-containing protein n=1 Tax=Elysia crispata TaxID=231223 RepID=A0AAE0XZJ0_9GAST|nr:hypothetical protein RRG08_055173 [Elysia crispata]